MLYQLPVFEFSNQYQPESYWTEAYFSYALPVLTLMGWLVRAVDDIDESITCNVLDGICDESLDEVDNYPFGLLWGLRYTGAIGPDIIGLDKQLIAWRAWIIDEYGIDADWLPDKSEDGIITYEH